MVAGSSRASSTDSSTGLSTGRGFCGCIISSRLVSDEPEIVVVDSSGGDPDGVVGSADGVADKTVNFGFDDVCALLEDEIESHNGGTLPSLLEFVFGDVGSAGGGGLSFRYSMLVCCDNVERPEDVS